MSDNIVEPFMFPCGASLFGWTVGWDELLQGMGMVLLFFLVVVAIAIGDGD